jgi:hypothetical protein
MEENDSISLEEVAIFLLKNKWKILLGAAFGLLLGLMVVYFQPKSELFSTEIRLSTNETKIHPSSVASGLALLESNLGKKSPVKMALNELNAGIDSIMFMGPRVAENTIRLRIVSNSPLKLEDKGKKIVNAVNELISVHNISIQEMWAKGEQSPIFKKHFPINTARPRMMLFKNVLKLKEIAKKSNLDIRNITSNSFEDGLLVVSMLEFAKKIKNIEAVEYGRILEMLNLQVQLFDDSEPVLENMKKSRHIFNLIPELKAGNKTKIISLPIVDKANKLPLVISITLLSMVLCIIGLSYKRAI